MSEIRTDGIISISPEAAQKLKEALDAVRKIDHEMKSLRQQVKDLGLLLKERYEVDPKVFREMCKIHRKGGDLNKVVEGQIPQDTARDLYAMVYGITSLK